MTQMTDSRHWLACFLGAGAVMSAVLTSAPVAFADPEPSTEQTPANGQQEQEQQQGPGNPLPRLNPPNNNGNPAGNEASKKGDLADIHCWMYSTGPEWFPAGAMPRPAGPGERPEPCYSVAGLTPHL